MVLVKTADATRVTQSLAEFASKVTYEDLPPEVVREAKRLILDTVGCALGGYTSDRGRIVRDLVSRLGGNQDSTVMGSGNRTSCTNAAFANGDMANYLDIDETLLNFAHPAAPVVHAAVPIAERERASGKELITSVVVGYDIAARAGAATEFYFSVTGDESEALDPAGVGWKTFGAAAAAGQILKLNGEQMVDALGMAGMLAPAPTLTGWWDSKGAMCKYYASGWVAQGGLTAALMAQAGYTGPQTILDVETGFFKADGFKTCDPAFMVKQLGEKWWITEVSYKPWPSCRHTHPPLTAFTRVIKENKIRGEEIEKVVVKGSFAASVALFWGKDAEEVHRGTTLISIPQLFALTAYNVTPGPEWLYFRQKPDDPRLAAFREKVSYEPDPAALEGINRELTGKAPKRFRKDPVSVEVYARGKIFRGSVEYAKGDPWSPESVMTDDELREKYKANAVDVLKGSSGWLKKIDAAMDMTYALEKIADVNELTSLLAP